MRTLRLLAVPLFFLCLALVWARPASLSPTDTVPDLGDPLHLGWVMAWDAHQLVRRPWALFESNGFHPYPHSLVFSDHLLPEALMVAPVFWATGNAVLALNVATVLALALSGTAMWLLVRDLTRSSAAGVVAGALYAFNSLTLHELPRVHVLNLQWWPLALLFLFKFARDGTLRSAAPAAACLALQGLSGTYYLAYTALLLPVWLAGVYVGLRRLPSRTEAGRLLAALAVAALPVGVLVLPYLRAFRGFGFEKSWAAGADLLSFVTPASGNWLWGGAISVAARAELPHFVGAAGGLLMVIGAVVALRRSADPRARAAALVAVLTALIGLLLALGPLVQAGGTTIAPGPYALLYRYVPLARGMASPERAGVLVYFGQAVLVGLAVAALLPRNRMARAALAVALAVLVPLEHWQPPRRWAEVPTGTDVPAVYRWLGEEGRGPVAEVPPLPERSRRLFASYLHFSTHHWRPILLGRASFYPPAHDWMAWHLREFPDDVSLAMLDHLDLRRVVVHPHVWDASERLRRLEMVANETRLTLVRRFPDPVPARYAPLGLGDERAYELGPLAPPAPPCRPADELRREGWTFASNGANKPERVADGDPATSWFTTRPQRPGDRLEVELPEPRTVAAVAVGIGYPHEEFARHPVVALLGQDGKWRRTTYQDGVAERLEVLEALLARPREAAHVLRFPPQRIRGVRVMIGFEEQDPAWPRWAVSELRLYSSCR